MRSLCTITIALALAAVLALPARAQSDLPWRLENYPNGGQSLTGMVSGTLIAQGDLIAPTCNELRPGNVQQLASGFSGISIAISDSDPNNAAIIVDGLPNCWKVLELTDADTRITLGAALALAARELAGQNLIYAQEIELVVAMSEDDILQTAYEIARGQDNLGQLIAQEGPDSSSGVPTPPPLPIGGGGIPSDS
jgi:hypothetical protein